MAKFEQLVGFLKENSILFSTNKFIAKNINWHFKWSGLSGVETTEGFHFILTVITRSAKYMDPHYLTNFE